MPVPYVPSSKSRSHSPFPSRESPEHVCPVPPCPQEQLPGNASQNLPPQKILLATLPTPQSGSPLLFPKLGWSWGRDCHGQVVPRVMLAIGACPAGAVLAGCIPHKMFWWETGHWLQPLGRGWAASGMPGPLQHQRPSLFCWRLDFYSGQGTLGQGRAGAPAQSTAVGRGSRLVYISLAVICINLLRSEPGFPHGQVGRMVVRLDQGALCFGSPPQPSPAGPAAPGTACFCQAPPSRSIVLPSPFSVSFVNVPNAAEASATQ